jgi:hypothetical protein
MTTALAAYHGGKSIIGKWFDKATGPAPLVGAAKHGLTLLRDYGEAAATGALLGAAKAELKGGLDFQFGSMNVPIDLGLALVGVVAPVIPQLRELSADARNVGAVGLGVYTMRKTEKLLLAKKGQVAGDFAGEGISYDPILDAARKL